MNENHILGTLGVLFFNDDSREDPVSTFFCVGRGSLAGIDDLNHLPAKKIISTFKFDECLGCL